MGESFCQCELQAAPGHGAPNPTADCLCGEEDDGKDNPPGSQGPGLAFPDSSLATCSSPVIPNRRETGGYPGAHALLCLTKITA